MCTDTQGGSVRDVAQHGEEGLGIPREISSRLGEIGGVSLSTECESGVPRGGEMLRAVACSNAALIFAEGHVANVVQAVLDAPVTAIVGQQLFRIGLRSGQRGDAVNDFRGPFPLAGLRVGQEAGAGDAEDLLDARPAQLLL